MELSLYTSYVCKNIKEAIKNYEINLSKIYAGRAKPQLLNSVKVNYYNEFIPVNQISVISVPEPRQLLIKPFEPNMAKEIIIAINNSSLNINPIDEGNQIRIKIPKLTKERRISLVKQTSIYTEQVKILIRSSRQTTNKMIKNNDKLSDDQQRQYLNEIQKLINKLISKVDNISSEKEKDLLKI